MSHVLPVKNLESSAIWIDWDFSRKAKAVGLKGDTLLEARTTWTNADIYAFVQHSILTRIAAAADLLLVVCAASASEDLKRGWRGRSKKAQLPRRDDFIGFFLGQHCKTIFWTHKPDQVETEAQKQIWVNGRRNHHRESILWIDEQGQDVSSIRIFTIPILFRPWSWDLWERTERKEQIKRRQGPRRRKEYNSQDLQGSCFSI